jgi:8-oxo-dGTP diphosphatase
MEISNSDLLVFGSRIKGVEYENRPAAYAVIRNPVGAFAVVGEGPGYILPGGGSEAGESPEETVRREVREELGRSVLLNRKLGEAIQYFQAGGRFYKMFAVFFAADLTNDFQLKGECELLWLTVSELEKNLFHECHKWAVRQG